jgi:hypothetical protein
VELQHTNWGIRKVLEEPLAMLHQNGKHYLEKQEFLASLEEFHERKD